MFIHLRFLLSHAVTVQRAECCRGRHLVERLHKRQQSFWYSSLFEKFNSLAFIKNYLSISFCFSHIYFIIERVLFVICSILLMQLKLSNVHRAIHLQRNSRSGELAKQRKSRNLLYVLWLFLDNWNSKGSNDSFESICIYMNRTFQNERTIQKCNCHFLHRLGICRGKLKSKGIPVSYTFCYSPYFFDSLWILIHYSLIDFESHFRS